MINFEENRYFNCIWFVSGNKVNWLGAIFRDAEGPWQLIYRFSYYEEDDTDHEDDRKSWYRAEAPREREESTLEANMEQMVGLVRAKFSFDANAEAAFWKVEFHSDNADANAEKFAQQPFVHLKHVNKLTGSVQQPGQA